MSKCAASACCASMPFPVSSLAEYGLLWATFAAIMQWGLEAGIAAGVVAATLYFALGYAQSQLSAFSLAPGRSRIVRAADQEAALELLRPTHLVSAQVGGPLATVDVICLLGTAAPCNKTCGWFASAQQHMVCCCSAPPPCHASSPAPPTPAERLLVLWSGKRHQRARARGGPVLGQRAGRRGLRHRRQPRGRRCLVRAGTTAGTAGRPAVRGQQQARRRAVCLGGCPPLPAPGSEQAGRRGWNQSKAAFGLAAVTASLLACFPCFGPAALLPSLTCVRFFTPACSVKGIDATAARTLASLLRCGVGQWPLSACSCRGLLPYCLHILPCCTGQAPLAPPPKPGLPTPSPMQGPRPAGHLPSCDRRSAPPRHPPPAAGTWCSPAA